MPRGAATSRDSPRLDGLAPSCPARTRDAATILDSPSLDGRAAPCPDSPGDAETAKPRPVRPFRAEPRRPDRDKPSPTKPFSQCHDGRTPRRHARTRLAQPGQDLPDPDGHTTTCEATTCATSPFHTLTAQPRHARTRLSPPRRPSLAMPLVAKTGLDGRAQTGPAPTSNPCASMTAWPRLAIPRRTVTASP